MSASVSDMKANKSSNRSSIDEVAKGIEDMLKGDKAKGRGVQVAAHGLLLMVEGGDFPEKLSWGALYSDSKAMTHAAKVVITSVLGKRPKFDAKSITDKSATSKQSRIAREAALKRAIKLTSILHSRDVKPSAFTEKTRCFEVSPDLLTSEGETLPFTRDSVPLNGDSVVIARDKGGKQSVGSVRCSVETVLKTHGSTRGPKEGSTSGNATNVSLAMAAVIVAKGITGKTVHEFADDETTRKALQDCLVQLMGVFGEENVQNIYKEAANG